jgi:hypothetical protein
MKTIFTTSKIVKGIVCTSLFPLMMSSQIDLSVGLNYSYNPPTNCNNQITGIAIDVCNNDAGVVSTPFIVGMYLYDPGTSAHWVIDQRTINSMNGNSVISISGWDINMNNYASLPAPGTSYRLGVWVDTANAITETNKNNNTSLLSGNIQVCALQGIKEMKEITGFGVYPNPSLDKSVVLFDLTKEEKINVSVFDLTGKLILNVFDGGLPNGHQKLSFQTNTIANGVYFITVNVSGGIITKKLIVQN